MCMCSLGTLRTCPDLSPDSFDFSVFMRILTNFRVLTTQSRPFFWHSRHFKTHETGSKGSDFKVWPTVECAGYGGHHTRNSELFSNSIFSVENTRRNHIQPDLNQRITVKVCGKVLPVRSTHLGRICRIIGSFLPFVAVDGWYLCFAASKLKE